MWTCQAPLGEHTVPRHAEVGLKIWCGAFRLLCDDSEQEAEAEEDGSEEEAEEEGSEEEDSGEEEEKEEEKDSGERADMEEDY